MKKCLWQFHHMFRLYYDNELVCVRANSLGLYNIDIGTVAFSACSHYSYVYPFVFTIAVNAEHSCETV